MRRADLLALFAADVPALVAVATDPADPAERRLVAVMRLGTCERLPSSRAVRAALAPAASEDPDLRARDQAAAGLRQRQSAGGLRLVRPATPKG